MEKKLEALFDYQKFEGNAELQSVIDAVHRRLKARAPLADDEADMVWAAGAPEAAFGTKPRKDPDGAL